MISPEARLWVLAAACLLLFIAAGVAVESTPASRFDYLGGRVRGSATNVAVAFTRTGRWPFLLVFSAAAVVLFAIARSNVLVPIAVLASQTASQGVVEAIKRLVQRLRPDYWLVGREVGYSFPSGHACTSIVFFGTWATVVALGPVPKPLKLAIAALLVLWIAGVNWSRLALGAHYLTDVAAGVLFGLAWYCAAWAMYVHLRLPLGA